MERQKSVHPLVISPLSRQIRPEAEIKSVLKVIFTQLCEQKRRVLQDREIHESFIDIAIKAAAGFFKGRRHEKGRIAFRQFKIKPCISA